MHAKLTRFVICDFNNNSLFSISQPDSCYIKALFYVTFHRQVFQCDLDIVTFQ